MDHEPIVNPIPPVVIVLCLIVVGVELVLSMGAAGFVGGPLAVGWRLMAMQDYGFSPAVLDRVLSVGDFSFDVIKRFVTYGFVHGQLYPIAVCGGSLACFGESSWATCFGQGRCLLVFVGSLIFGAIVFGLFVGGTTPLLGIYPCGLRPDWRLYLRDLAAPWADRAKPIAGLPPHRRSRSDCNWCSACSLAAAPSGSRNSQALPLDFGISTVAAPGGWTALLVKTARALLTAHRAAEFPKFEGADDLADPEIADDPDHHEGEQG